MNGFLRSFDAIIKKTLLNDLFPHSIFMMNIYFSVPSGAFCYIWFIVCMQVEWRWIEQHFISNEQQIRILKQRLAKWFFPPSNLLCVFIYFYFSREMPLNEWILSFLRCARTISLKYCIVSADLRVWCMANDGINCIWSFMNRSWENVWNQCNGSGFFYWQRWTHISMSCCRKMKQILHCNQKQKYDVTDTKLSWNYDFAFAV